ncbi:MAG: YggT family protein [Thiopseudomonas sp.]|nr:YggT family protein [Thiopseudomonas sp.]MCK9464332.1 YggT family protein [Thiopseudomonas sp.]
MSGLSEAFIYILQTLGQLYIFVVLFRFILQLVRADFYNPISQFVVKITQPLLTPLRKIIPGFAGLDFAALVLAFLVHMVLAITVLMLAGAPALDILLQLAIWCLISLSALFMKIFFFALIISIILSWVAPGSFNPAAQLINQVCQPVLAPIRRLLPDLGGIDISPIFAFIALNLIDRFVIEAVAKSTGLVGPLRALISPFL